MSKKLDKIFIKHFERELKDAEQRVKDCKKVLHKIKKP